MPTIAQQRHQIIERAVRRSPDGQADDHVALWNLLAVELGKLIGERGFKSLYARSLYRASAAFPWMLHLMSEVSPGAFIMADFRLSTNDPAEAQAAHAALLKIFTDTLMLLIGEALTNNILREAWGDDVVDNAGTESGS
jgi:hypothetical protein